MTKTLAMLGALALLGCGDGVATPDEEAGTQQQALVPTPRRASPEADWDGGPVVNADSFLEREWLHVTVVPAPDEGRLFYMVEPTACPPMPEPEPCPMCR